MVYRRPEAYYVVAGVRTTAGVWLDDGPVAVVGADADGTALAAAVAAAVTVNAAVVPHPRQDQWTEQRRQPLGSLMRQAGVRSWKAFVLPATLVSVYREGTRCVVTPYRRDDRRYDVFDEIARQCIELPSCTADQLAPALAAAFRIAAGQTR